MPYTLLTPTLYQLESLVSTASFTTKQDISTPAGGQPYAMPPNTITTVGQTLRIHAMGSWSATATPTFTIGLYIGSTGAFPALSGAGNNDLAAQVIAAATALTDIPWELEYYGTFTAVGGSGGVLGGGNLKIGTSATAFTTYPWNNTTIGGASLATPIPVNTAKRQSIVVSGSCTANSASNILRVSQFSIELLN